MCAIRDRPNADIPIKYLFFSLNCDISHVLYLSDWGVHVARLMGRRTAIGIRSYVQGRDAILLWLTLWP